MMRNVWRNRLLVFFVLSFLPFGSSRAMAHGHLARLFGWTPTYYVETIPTAYVLPTSYVMATSYAYSPALVATSYYLNTTTVIPTSYVTTSCDCDDATILSPTSYASVVYSPRVFESVISRPACSTCGTTVVTPSTSYSKAAPIETITPAPTSKVAPPAEQATPRAEIESEPVNPPNPAAAQPRDSMSKRENTLPSRSSKSAEPAIDSGITPPAAPVDDKDLNQPAQATPINPDGGAAKPPVAPGGLDAPIEIPDGGEGNIKREAYKPVPSQPYIRTAMRRNLNVLQGKVVSGDSAEPEEGVELSFTNRDLNTTKQAVSDAYGKYAVRLADGDWTVKVTMPSGRVYAVSQLSVRSGQITDELGRDIPSLTITR